MKRRSTFFWMAGAAILAGTAFVAANHPMQVSHPQSACHMAQPALHMQAMMHMHSMQMQAMHMQAMHAQTAWQHQAWHAQAKLATSVAVVPGCQHLHHAAHSAAATANLTQLHHETFAPVVVLSQTSHVSTQPSVVVYGRQQPSDPVQTIVQREYQGNLPALSAPPSQSSTLTHVSISRDRTLDTLRSVDTRTAAEQLFLANLQASPTINISISTPIVLPPGAGTQAFVPAGIDVGNMTSQTGFDFSSTTVQSARSFGDMSLQNQLISMNNWMHGAPCLPVGVGVPMYGCYVDPTWMYVNPMWTCGNATMTASQDVTASTGAAATELAVDPLVSNVIPAAADLDLASLPVQPAMQNTLALMDLSFQMAQAQQQTAAFAPPMLAQQAAFAPPMYAQPFAQPAFAQPAFGPMYAQPAYVQECFQGQQQNLQMQQQNVTMQNFVGSQQPQVLVQPLVQVQVQQILQMQQVQTQTAMSQTQQQHHARLAYHHHMWHPQRW